MVCGLASDDVLKTLVSQQGRHSVTAVTAENSANHFVTSSLIT